MSTSGAPSGPYSRPKPNAPNNHSGNRMASNNNLYPTINSEHGNKYEKITRVGVHARVGQVLKEVRGALVTETEVTTALNFRQVQENVYLQGMGPHHGVEGAEIPVSAAEAWEAMSVSDKLQEKVAYNPRHLLHRDSRINVINSIVQQLSNKFDREIIAMSVKALMDTHGFTLDRKYMNGDYQYNQVLIDAFGMVNRGHGILSSVLGNTFANLKLINTRAMVGITTTDAMVAMKSLPQSMSSDVVRAEDRISARTFVSLENERVQGLELVTPPATEESNLRGHVSVTEFVEQDPGGAPVLAFNQSKSTLQNVDFTKAASASGIFGLTGEVSEEFRTFVKKFNKEIDEASRQVLSPNSTVWGKKNPNAETLMSGSDRGLGVGTYKSLSSDKYMVASMLGETVPIPPATLHSILRQKAGRDNFAAITRAVKDCKNLLDRSHARPGSAAYWRAVTEGFGMTSANNLDLIVGSLRPAVETGADLDISGDFLNEFGTLPITNEFITAANGVYPGLDGPLMVSLADFGERNSVAALSPIVKIVKWMKELANLIGDVFTDSAYLKQPTHQMQGIPSTAAQLINTLVSGTPLMVSVNAVTDATAAPGNASWPTADPASYDLAGLRAYANAIITNEAAAAPQTRSRIDIVTVFQDILNETNDADDDVKEFVRATIVPLFNVAVPSKWGGVFGLDPYAAALVIANNNADDLYNVIIQAIRSNDGSLESVQGDQEQFTFARSVVRLVAVERDAVDVPPEGSALELISGWFNARVMTTTPDDVDALSNEAIVISYDANFRSVVQLTANNGLIRLPLTVTKPPPPTVFLGTGDARQVLHMADPSAPFTIAGIDGRQTLPGLRTIGASAGGNYSSSTPAVVLDPLRLSSIGEITDSPIMSENWTQLMEYSNLATSIVGRIMATSKFNAGLFERAAAQEWPLPVKALALRTIRYNTAHLIVTGAEKVSLVRNAMLFTPTSTGPEEVTVEVTMDVNVMAMDPSSVIVLKNAFVNGMDLAAAGTSFYNPRTGIGAFRSVLVPADLDLDADLDFYGFDESGRLAVPEMAFFHQVHGGTIDASKNLSGNRMFHADQYASDKTPTCMGKSHWGASVYSEVLGELRVGRRHASR